MEPVYLLPVHSKHVQRFFRVYWFFTLWVPGTTGAMIGFQKGNNVATGGSLTSYYGSLLSAPEPVLYVNALFVLWDVVTFLAAVYTVYHILRSDVGIRDVIENAASVVR